MQPPSGASSTRKIISLLKDNPDPQPFATAARRLIFLKGRDSHDYKFSSAVLEDYYHVSPAWRDRVLASSFYYLPSSRSPDNKLVARIHAAFGA